MKGNKTKIASMILAASVTFMASACTVKISNNDTASTTEKISGSEATTEATSSLPESSDEETESTTTLSESTSEKQITTNSIPAQYVEVLDYLYDGLKSGENASISVIFNVFICKPGIIKPTLSGSKSNCKRNRM